MNRTALTPSSALPLVYFGLAHISLAFALAALVVEPTLTGQYFLHPRMAAVVHLVTAGWISGSILGAFYVVAPLALGMPLPVRWPDWVGCAAFTVGLAGMVDGFRAGHYASVSWFGAILLVPVVWLGVRAAAGRRRATAPAAVMLHVYLAFANLTAAALLGIVIGLDRAMGVLGLPPVAMALAHLHLAVIGWPVMLIVGLAYRLVPMFLPSRMPLGRALAASAICLEAGLVVVVGLLLFQSHWLPVGAALVAAGVTVFGRNMRAAVRQRLPRPPALPARDWSTWQAHAAVVWLFVALGLGVALTFMPVGPGQVQVAWLYGVAGIVGFVAQIVVGIQGRLVPLYAYYRAMSARQGQPPHAAANALPDPRFARPIFLCWLVGVPLLAWGLVSGLPAVVRVAAGCLLTGVALGGAYLEYLMRTARRPAPTNGQQDGHRRV